MRAWDSIVDIDREERRSARYAAEAAFELHPVSCRCRECLVDAFDPRDAQ